MKNVFQIIAALALTMGVSSSSEIKSVEYAIKCVPIFEVTVPYKNTKRHSLVLKDDKRECRVWLEDGEQPELRNLNLKPNKAYKFILVSRPDWAGAAVAQAGVTSPPGFLKRIMEGDRIICEDKTFKELGIWK